MFACARICVEVDIEKGLSKEISLSMNNWTHIQNLEYEQLSFKCKAFHEYGYFTKNYKLIASTQDPPKNKEQW